MSLARWLPALLIYVIISWFSHQPRWPDAVVGQPDWLLHGVAYGLLSAAVWYGIGRQIGPEGRALLAIVVTGVAGALDEYHQSFIAGRIASGGDVLADGAGAVLGVAAAFAFDRLATSEHEA